MHITKLYLDPPIFLYNIFSQVGFFSKVMKNKERSCMMDCHLLTLKWYLLSDIHSPSLAH